jgi:hypothetical protein
VATCTAYLVYLLVGVGATVWVARTAAGAGVALLAGTPSAKAAAAAEPQVRLVVLGVSLLDLGFVLLNLPIPGSLTGAVRWLEVVAQKLGLVLLVLGVLHLVCLSVFNRLRERAWLEAAPPPAAPDEVLVRAGPPAGGAP